MRNESIARNYAEALLALATKANAARPASAGSATAMEEWGGLMHAVAGGIEAGHHRTVGWQRFRDGGVRLRKDPAPGDETIERGSLDTHR